MYFNVCLLFTLFYSVLAAIERSAKLAMDGVEFDSPTKQNSKPKS